VAIVTGSAMGIGQATAVLFGREGANVVVADINEEEGKATAKQIKDEGNEAIFVHVDVTKEDLVKRMAEMTATTYGGIDVLIANAGTFALGKIHELSNEEWDRIMNIDLKGAFWCCKHVIPYMLKRGKGSIVVTSSVNALVAEPELGVYCAAKAAMCGLVRAIALDYGPNNIRANALLPGTIDTPMNIEYLNAQRDPVLARREIEAIHVLGRLGTPMEMAYCMVFLASDESSFVTASCMVADGGMTAIINPAPAFKVS
jgi:NAD(P)-dependent dehydrogenase (short-subunit alcohol dehydrogenase family)